MTKDFCLSLLLTPVHFCSDTWTCQHSGCWGSEKLETAKTLDLQKQFSTQGSSESFTTALSHYLFTTTESWQLPWAASIPLTVTRGTLKCHSSISHDHNNAYFMRHDTLGTLRDTKLHSDVLVIWKLTGWGGSFQSLCVPYFWMEKENKRYLQWPPW